MPTRSPRLKAPEGIADLGIHAEVIEAGTIALGDAIEVLEPEDGE